MKSFVRVTKLNNVQNRADYIHDPKRQEEIVCKSESVDFSEYQQFEAAKRKPGERSYEGRELVIAIPNEWYDLPRAELHQRAEFLVDKALGKTEDVAWAVHWNKDRTNLHIQAVFSERQKEKNPGVWDRTIYQSKDGGVARRKADRATNPDGSFIVLHKKGEAKGGFTSKDPEYTKPEWLPKVKKELQQTMEQQYGVKFAKPGVLHEYHEGNGDSAPAIAATNVLIRANNEQEQLIRSYFPLMPEAEVKAVMMEAVNACGVVRVGTDTIWLEQHFEVMRGEPFQIREGEYILPEPDGVLRSPEQLQAYKEVVLQEEPEHIEVVQTQPPKEAASERMSLIARLRDTLSAILVKRSEKALEGRQKPTHEPEPERRRVSIPEPKKPSEKLRTAFGDLKAAQELVSSARHDLSKANAMWGWGKKKKEAKAAASRDLYDAQKECQDAFTRVVSYGVSTYRDGVQLTAANLDQEDMKYLDRHVEWKINDLEREEAHAEKPRLSENLSEAMKRYKEHQKEIAPAVEARMKEKSKSQSKGGPDR